MLNLKEFLILTQPLNHTVNYFIQKDLHENRSGQELMFHLQSYILTKNPALNGIPCNLYNLLLTDDREVFYLIVSHWKLK